MTLPKEFKEKIVNIQIQLDDLETKKEQLLNRIQIQKNHLISMETESSIIVTALHENYLNFQQIAKELGLDFDIINAEAKRNKIHVHLYPIENGFKPIDWDGYTASGVPKNSKKIDAVAKKINEAFSVFGLKCSVLTQSLEDMRRNFRSVVIVLSVDHG